MKLDRDDFKKLANQNKVSAHEALLLLSKILSEDYSKLFFSKFYELSNEKFELFLSFLSRRRRGEPIAKIIEQKEFYGFPFKTTRDTLDPRPETELIIDLFKKIYSNMNINLRILDLGAGTGCIGITILKLYQNANCCFIDISEDALKIAEENAKTNKVYERSTFLKSNWFKNVKSKFDVIVSNPPYVEREYSLDAETKYDPEIALFAENHGMEAFNQILAVATKFINPDGYLFMEIGYNQLQALTNIKTNLVLKIVEKDLAGFDRVCVFQNSK